MALIAKKGCEQIFGKVL